MHGPEQERRLGEKQEGRGGAKQERRLRGKQEKGLWAKQEKGLRSFLDAQGIGSEKRFIKGSRQKSELGTGKNSR